MRLLVLDCELQGLDLCLRAIADGHQVRWFRPTPRPMGQGFPGLRIIDDWRKDGMEWVGKDGLVFLTGNAKWLSDLDRYRDLGFRIFGPTYQSAQLEINRAKGMEAMKAVGIEIAPYHVFDSLEEAERFAMKADQPYVFKPMGDEEDKALTMVAHDPADLVGWLRRKIAGGRRMKGQCMLQEKLDMACEIGISGWFGPEGFLPEKYQVCFEFKKLCNDGKGPATGEMGTGTCYVESDKLADEFLLPFAPILATLGHRGDFAIGLGMDKKGKIWPFEFTMRAGWPCRYIQDAAHKGDCIQWMSDLMDGEDSLRVDYRPAVGVVFAIPPFPQWNGSEEKVCGNPIDGLEENWAHIHPCMMMRGKGPYMEDGKIKEGMVYQTCGEEPLVVTGLGRSMSKAIDAVYKVADQVKMADGIYRTDIGSCLEEQLPLCHKAGYALDVQW